MPFEASDSNDAALGRALSVKVSVRAQQENPEFLQFLNVEKMEDIMRERNFQMSSLVDPSSAVAMGRDLGIHAFVYGNLTGVVTNDTGLRQVSKTNTVDWPVYNDKGKVTGYEKLTAHWTEYYHDTSANVTATYEIVEVENRRSSRQPEVEAQRQDSYSYAAFNSGDERAVPFAVKDMMQRRPRDPKPVEALVQECLNELADTMALNLVRQFR